MSKDRTLSAGKLSTEDTIILESAKKITNAIVGTIQDPLAKADFSDAFAKISLTRDAGAGRGGGKLQRDALCTRGKTDMTPISNRNLRWHPMLVSKSVPEFAEPVTDIYIETSNGFKELGFVVKIGSVNQKILGKEIYQLEEPFCAPSDSWEEVKNQLQDWTREDWGRNRCVIPSMEYSDRSTALRTFASLAVAVVTERYEVPLENVMSAVEDPQIPDFLDFRSIFENIDDLKQCPLCKKGFSQPLDSFRSAERVDNWQAPWTTSKRSEGDDSSLQIMHVSPLLEGKIMHNPSNVRFGHRWCNITMTDHALEDVINFFEYVASEHKKGL